MHHSEDAQRRLNRVRNYVVGTGLSYLLHAKDASLVRISWAVAGYVVFCCWRHHFDQTTRARMVYGIGGKVRK